jgi:hypothetical protein
VRRRPIYRRTCRSPVRGVLLAPLVPEAITKGWLTTGFLAWLLTERFVLGRPDHRIVAALAHDGFDMAEGTLAVSRAPRICNVQSKGGTNSFWIRNTLVAAPSVVGAGDAFVGGVDQRRHAAGGRGTGTASVVIMHQDLRVRCRRQHPTPRPEVFPRSSRHAVNNVTGHYS